MGEGEPPAGARGGQTPTANTPGGDGMPKSLSPARYLGWLYSTDAQKPVLATLLEIEAEIAGGLRPGIEHHVAHARLQWWSEEAERVAQGRPVHPLAKELVKAHASGAGISGLVDTAVWDLARATFETRRELTAYCERWATAMFGTAASARSSMSVSAPELASGRLGVGASASDLVRGTIPQTVGMAEPDGPTGAPSVWKSLGAAVRELELLAGAARDAHDGQVRVPLDELDRAGVEPSALAKLPWPAPLTALLKERHQSLRATLATQMATLDREQQMHLRGLLVWVTLTWRLSVRAERALPNVILPRRYDALADGWQAWRAARRAATGKLRLV
jgi:phytoene synthase